MYFKLLDSLGQHNKEKREKLKIQVPVYLFDWLPLTDKKIQLLEINYNKPFPVKALASI